MPRQAAIAVRADFDHRTLGPHHPPLGEIGLFRALIDALVAGAPGVEVEEYHGGAHQVFHDTAPLVGLGQRRCELADLMIVAFHVSPRVVPRLTFLQAKYERRPIPQGPVGPQCFNGSYVQWSLLSSRPPIAGRGQFAPPPDLLSGAPLASVGSFGFFMDDPHRPGAAFNMVYASADELDSHHPPPTGRLYGGLHAQGGDAHRPVGPLLEAIACSSLENFLCELFSMKVGTPLQAGPWNGVSWLVAELSRLAAVAGRPLARLLIERLGQAAAAGRGGQDDDRGGPTPPETARVPARSLALLKASVDLG